MAIQNEDIIFTTQVKGDEELNKLRTEIDAVKDGSSELSTTTQALVDNLGKLNATAAKIDAFRALKKEVGDNTKALADAQKKAAEMGAALAATDAPTKKQTAEFAKLTKAVGTLKDGVQAQAVALQRTRTALDAAGVSTRNLSAAQGALREVTRATRGAIVDNIVDLRAMSQAHKNAGVVGTKAQTDIKDAIKQTTSSAGVLRTALTFLSTYVGFTTIVRGLRSIIETGDRFEKFRLQLESTFQSAALGEQAFGWIKQFARDTPLRVSQVLEAFVKLKNFGLDPTKGALQAIVDQNAKVGGSQVKLERVILGVGQAWSKQRLQNEEILQLIEAGVPVYAILEKQLNLTTLQITKMAEQGKLGRDVIQKLLDGIASSSAGAAQKQMATLSGLISNAGDNMELFFDQISRSGALAALKRNVSELNDQFTRLTNSGEINKYAQSISNAFVSVISSIKTVTLFLVNHAAQIYEVGRAYLVFKTLSFVTARLSNIATALVAMANTARAATGNVGLLSAALRSIPGVFIVTVALLGAEKAIAGAKALGERLAENSDAVKSLRTAQEAFALTSRDMSQAFGRLRDSLSKYSDTAILTAQQVAALNEEERKAYRDKLEGLTEYLNAQRRAEALLVEIGDLTAEEAQRTYTSLATVKQAFADLDAGIKLATDAAKENISVAALEIAAKLGSISTSATLAEAGLKGVFQGLDIELTTVTKLGDIALAVTALAGESVKADNNLKSGLRTTLNVLSTTDLLRFQSSATAAFATFNTDVDKASLVLDTVLQLALERVGVSADKMGVSFTQASRETIAAFTIIAENAQSTASQVEAAFDAALSTLTSVDQVKALGDELAAAFSQGKIGADAMARSTNDITRRLRELELQVNPLAESFGRLGIKSQQELDGIARSAKDAFNAISTGARKGQTSVEDVRAAFVAYARTQLDAVKNSDEFKRAQVEAALALEASKLGAVQAAVALQELGIEGEAAGNKIEAGANKGAAALGGLATAANTAAVAATNTGSSAKGMVAGVDAAAASLARAGQEAKDTSVDLGEVSQAFVDAGAQANARGISGVDAVTAALARQRDVASERITQMDAELARYDPLTAAVARLSSEFDYLDQATLRILAEKELRLKELRAKEKENEKPTEVRGRGAIGNKVDDAAKAEKDKIDEVDKAAKEAADKEALRKKIALEDAKRAKDAQKPDPTTTGIDTPTVKSELVLKVISEQSGTPIRLSNEQLDTIVAAVVTKLQRSQTNS